MMMYAQCPSWRQLAGHIRQPEDEEPFWKDGKYIFTRSSAVSLRLVFSAYRKLSGKKEVHVFLPAYFCQETLNEIQGRGVRIFFYEIDGNMEPDWKRLKEKKNIPADLFVFCHYFGIFHDVSRARNFCDQKKAVLIEDCAHVLYPAGRYGRKGDFVLYSPHKVIPVPDGGILAWNSSKLEITEKMAEMIAGQCSIPVKDACVMWRLKKAVQKVTRIQKKLPEKDGPHYGKAGRTTMGRSFQGRLCQGSNMGSCQGIQGRLHLGSAMAACREEDNLSAYSLKYIQSLTKTQLKEMAYIRRQNLKVMDWLVRRIEPGAVSLANEDDPCPYFAPYLVHSPDDRKHIRARLKALGLPVFYWPDLPEELEVQDAYGIEKEFSKALIAVPIHQGIRPQAIAGIMSHTEHADPGFSLCFIENSKEGYKTWKSVMGKIRLGNIPQDWGYGDVKRRAEKWGLERAVILDCRGEEAGVLQILRKCKAGITVAVRVNRGPLLVPEYDTTENQLKVMELVRRHYKHPIPILYAPDLEFNGENLVWMTQYGWRQWDLFGFPSGLLDLTQGEEAIRKNLDGKWRNQLKAAEKKGLEIRTDTSRFCEMLDLYEKNQQEKGYKGIPRNILCGLMGRKRTPLRLMYLVDEEGAVTAFDIFYTASGFGLYLVGWNSDKGRKQYANNLLLYQAAVRFKKEGLKWLDLGGIDHIHTEENALFKDGMRPAHYQLLGEFVKF